MIYAYSAGCLNKDEFIEFMHSTVKEGLVDLARLNELQRTMSLLPLVLEQEMPAPELKELILSRISVPVMPGTQPAQSKPVITENFAHEDMTVSQNTYAGETKPADRIKGKAEANSAAETAEAAQGTMVQRGPSSAQSATPEAAITEASLALELRNLNERNEKRFRTGIYVLSSTLALSVILMFIITNFFSGKVEKQNNRILQLQEKISALSNEIQAQNTRQLVSTVLKAGDAKAVELGSAMENSGASGQFTLSRKEQMGVLQLTNLPALANNHVYKLWIEKKDGWISLGSFRPAHGNNMIPVTGFPALKDEKSVNYVVTMETSQDAAVPRGKVYLSSSGKNAAASAVKPGKAKRFEETLPEIKEPSDDGQNTIGSETPQTEDTQSGR